MGYFYAQSGNSLPGTAEHGIDTKIRAHWIVHQEDFGVWKAWSPGSLTQTGLNRPGWPAKGLGYRQDKVIADETGGPDPGSGRMTDDMGWLLRRRG